MTLLDDVQRRFVPRFVALAQERIRAGLALTTAPIHGDEALHLARELHSLAGEAGLLGFSHLLAIARTAEEAATEFHARQSEQHARALTSALGALHDAVDHIASSIDEPSP